MPDPQQVVHRSEATLRFPDGAVHGVAVTLVGGRHRYRVGGQVAEGFRWWHGRVDPPCALPPVDPGTEIIIDITGASPAVAIVDAADTDRGNVFHFSGKGAPPFDVDSSRGVTRSHGAASH